jgi:hypothetical protein
MVHSVLRTEAQIRMSAALHTALEQFIHLLGCLGAAAGILGSSITDTSHTPRRYQHTDVIRRTELGQPEGAEVWATMAASAP